MTEQYFADHPHAKHDLGLIHDQINEITLDLTTDAGVFSKHRVDYGSAVLIKQLQGQVLPAGDLLDMGCGYGPIGLFAAKFWPQRHVDMVDVNERALKLAQLNAQTNHLANVSIFASDSYDQIEHSYALIMTNPPIRAGKTVVSEMLSGAKAHLVSGGLLLAVIQKKQGEPSARRLMHQTFGNCDILTRDKGYYVLKSVQS